MTINKFAPVLIPTLNRYEHFKRCVESLSNCTHAEKTDLFIALDYPLNESHWEGYRKIDEYVKTITGFKSITIIRRDVNYGVSNNIRDARERIFDQYDRMIFSEDDNEFSKTFLVFINTGLEKYENNKDIYFICGYNYPIKMPKSHKEDIYFSYKFSAWGYGTWEKKLNLIDWNIETLKEFMDSKKNSKILKKYSNTAYNLLLKTLKTGKAYGDAIVEYNLIKKKGYSVFPVLSKVRNYGNDGSGLNCSDKQNDIFSKQELDEGNNNKFPNEITINKIIWRKLKRYSSSSILNKVRRRFYHYL